MYTDLLVVSYILHYTQFKIRHYSITVTKNDLVMGLPYDLHTQRAFRVYSRLGSKTTLKKMAGSDSTKGISLMPEKSAFRVSHIQTIRQR